MQAVKLTAWLERKIKQALQKNMVFPACTDIKMPFLMDHGDLLTDNLLGLHIPTPHSTKPDTSAKAGADEGSKDGAPDKPYHRSESVADSFGASSVAAAVEHHSDSAPAALPYTEEEGVPQPAVLGQDESSEAPAAEAASSTAPPARNSTDQRPAPAEQPRVVSRDLSHLVCAHFVSCPSRTLACHVLCAAFCVVQFPAGTAGALGPVTVLSSSSWLRLISVLFQLWKGQFQFQFCPGGQNSP